jgi:pyridoxamine 5'-phosphate oxidase family protein
MMSAFSDSERSYLTGERRLGRIATCGPDATPHVAPVGFAYNTDADTVDVGGRDLAATKKFRDTQRLGRAAIVIDDLASIDPWRPRGVEVRGRAETISFPVAVIRIHPDRVVSWGLDESNPVRARSSAAEGS